VRCRDCTDAARPRRATIDRFADDREQERGYLVFVSAGLHVELRHLEIKDVDDDCRRPEKSGKQRPRP
jgi:hypothetical protein